MNEEGGERNSKRGGKLKGTRLVWVCSKEVKKEDRRRKGRLRNKGGEAPPGIRIVRRRRIIKRSYLFGDLVWGRGRGRRRQEEVGKGGKEGKKRGDTEKECLLHNKHQKKRKESSHEERLFSS